MLASRKLRHTDIFTALGYLSFLALPLWIFARSKQFQTWLAGDFLALAPILEVLVPVIPITAVTFLVFSLSPAAPAETKPTSPPIPILRWVIPLVSFTLFSEIVFLSVATPLDWDELRMGSALADVPFGKIILLFNDGILGTTTTLHPLAAVCEWLALHLPISGWIAVRIPSLVAALGTTLLIVNHVTRHFSIGERLLVLGALAANRTWIHYAYSSRGYSTLVFFSVAFYLLCRRIAAGQKVSDLLLFSTAGLLCFTTVHGPIFGILVSITLLVVSAKPKTEHWARPLLLLAGFVMAVSVYKLFWIGTPNGPDAPTTTLWEAAGYLGGVSAASAARLLSFTAFVLIAVRMYCDKWGFDERFFAISVLILAMIFTLKEDGWQDRYFLPLLFPWLLCFASSVQWFAQKRRTMLPLMIAALITIVIPTLFRDVVEESITYRWRAFHEFTREAVSLVPDSEPLVILGAFHQSQWAAKLYARRSAVTPPTESVCRPRYFLHYGISRRVRMDPDARTLLNREWFALLHRRPSHCLKISDATP